MLLGKLVLHTTPATASAGHLYLVTYKPRHHYTTDRKAVLSV